MKASRATREGNILVLQSGCGFVWSHGQGHRLLRQTDQIQTLFTFYILQDFGQVAFFTFLQYIMEAVVTTVTSLELGRIQWKGPLRYGAVPLIFCCWLLITATTKTKLQQVEGIWGLYWLTYLKYSDTRGIRSWFGQGCVIALLWRACLVILCAPPVVAV